MNILWNTWEPALTDGNSSTSAGGGAWTRALWSYFQSKGHNVYNVSVGENSKRIEALSNGINSKPDVIVLCWRWPMAQYKSRHHAYLRQTSLLDYAYHENIPILIHNQDLKFEPIDACDKFIQAGKRIAFTMPAFNPPEGYESLHFPCPYDLDSSEWAIPTRKELESRPYDYAYIGNNYERYEQIKAAWGDPNKISNVHIWGNWLEHSKHRESPETVREDFPHVEFHGRLPQERVLETLNQSLFTHHFCKPLYSKYGFMTIRWSEAIAASCIAEVSSDFNMPNEYKEFFHLNKLPDNWSEYNVLLAIQRGFVKGIQSPEPWLEKVEELIQ